MADEARKQAALLAVAKRLDAAMAEEAREYTPPVLEPLPYDPAISEDTRIKHDRARTQEFAGRLMRDAPVPEVTLQDRAELLAEQRARYKTLPAGHPIKANLKRVIDDAQADVAAREPSSMRPGTYYYALDPEHPPEMGVRLTPQVPEPDPTDDAAMADYEAQVAKGILEKVVIPDPDDAPPVVRTIPKDPNAYKALLDMFGVTGLMGREKK